MPAGTRLPVQPIRDRRPLSVQVYDRLVETLSKSVQPGEAIPPEIELAADLGVSRTVLREALRLLEEDGVIVRGADPRRRHLATPSARPPSFTAPLEEMLLGPAPLRVNVVRTDLIDTTNWSRALLEVGEHSKLLCRESLFLLDEEQVASALELVPRGESSLPHKIAAAEPGTSAPARTLLADLGPQFRAKCSPTLWRLVQGSSARSRTGFHHIPLGHLTSLTTVLSRQGRPAFLAKYLIRLDKVALAVGAQPSGADSLTLDLL
jgi:GntR family transcriptional regulator